MTDQQVVNYARRQAAAGVSQDEIARQLLRRGVTEEQVNRIRTQYENRSDGNTTAPEQLEAVRTTSRANTPDGYEEAAVRDEQTIAEIERESESRPETSSSNIYGHSLFNNRRLTFEPSMNMPTPTNYQLGPGDEVIIDIWGASENRIRQVITPEGNIQVSGIGPMHLSGMTVRAANDFLQKEFSRIYSGLNGQDPDSQSQIQLTLGNVRSIQVTMVGEVGAPGNYTLSGFSSVFHALYRAGGVNRIGSLRNIKVIRNGRTIATLDVYQILMQGKMTDDIRLQDGDVIRVDTYKELVQLEGKVRRPMYYEMKENESLQTLLNYAGGFTGDAYKRSIRIIRKSGEQYEVRSVNEIDYGTFVLNDGDMVSVEAVLDRFENRIEIRGAVYRPGVFQLDGTVNTVKALINKAEGLRDDAFTGRALLDREKDDLSHEMISIDLRGLMNGTVPDIALQKNDMLYIASEPDLKQEERVTITGQVLNAGTYLFSENMTLEDLIMMAGGLREAAATTKIEVTRRIKDPKSQNVSSTLTESFILDIEGDLEKSSDIGFKLQPFDVVSIRKSPVYNGQVSVSISGEVPFAGSYSLNVKNERLSSVVNRAGGVTPDAYVKGARLTRTMNAEERRNRRDVIGLARSADSDEENVQVSGRDIATTYSVAIDLEEALRNPGSEADLVLREGDVIFIPEMNNTVKIMGEVMYPNTVTYNKNRTLKEYINLAGGYGDKAIKRKVYVIYPNGSIAKKKRWGSVKIDPGSEIIVPTKPEKEKRDTTSNLAVVSMVSSMAAMVATLFRALK